MSENGEGFYSRLFLVLKKDGQMRPVINLRPLNQFLVHSHFKMEEMHVVKDLRQKNDWMTRIDLKDACFSIPINLRHQKFLPLGWLQPRECSQNSLTCSGFLTQQRDTMCNLPGRHSPSRARQDQAYRAHGNNLVATRSVG